MSLCALIVDDEPAIATGLRLRLEAIGWSALTAHDGVNGVQLARAHLPEVIILDMRMPRQDGLQTLAELRVCRETADIPVLMISGSDRDRQAALDAGANGFMKKPYRTNDMLQAILDLGDCRARGDGLCQGAGRIRTEPGSPISRQGAISVHAN